jgi:hypothetical protein
MEIFSRDEIDYTIEDCSLGDIFNYNELLVIEIMRQIYQENDSFCRCPICIEDTFALSVNSLPTRYIQMSNVEKYINSNNYVNEQMVRQKVLEAFRKIKNNPGH